MDMETGEYCHDIETGEILSAPSFDVETGENESCSGRKFKVPKAYYTPVVRRSKKPYKPRKANEKELQLITAVIFLLPTMIFFYPILSIIAMLLEIFLHNWSHEKNKMLQSNAIYFQSPLHGILKEFCGKCKEENALVKITKFQDIKNDKIRKYRLDCLKRVVT